MDADWRFCLWMQTSASVMDADWRFCLWMQTGASVHGFRLALLFMDADWRFCLWMRVPETTACGTPTLVSCSTAESSAHSHRSAS
eukprot:1528809-Rhodomonas_salina.2